MTVKRKLWNEYLLVFCALLVIKKLLSPVTKVKKFTENIAIAQDLNANAWYAHLQPALERETNGKSNGLIKHYFPVGTDFIDLTDREIERVM